MSVLLLILGLLSVVAGGGMILFGIPINEFGLGNTLIMAGVTALTGGFLLIGLSAAVRQLRRIAEALTAPLPPRALRPGEPLEPHAPGGVRPLARPPLPPRRPPIAPEGPAPEPRIAGKPRMAAPAADVSAEAIDRLRSSFPRLDHAAGDSAAVPAHEDVPLSPRAPMPKVTAPAPVPPPAPAAVRVEPPAEVKADERPAPTEGTEGKPRLNFPWRSKPRAEAAPAPPAPPAPNENFDRLWPPSTRPAPTDDAPAIQPNGDKPVSAPAAPTPEPTVTPAAEAPGPAPAAILKSGVVDGMAYTLYADGSIEAKLPEGTVRFGSIAELRDHLETHESQN